MAATAATMAAKHSLGSEETTASSTDAAGLSEEVRALRQVVADNQKCIRQLLEGQQRMEASLSDSGGMQPMQSDCSIGTHRQPRQPRGPNASALAKFKAEKMGSVGSIGTLSSSQTHLEGRSRILDALPEHLSEKFKSKSGSSIQSRRSVHHSHASHNSCQRITEHPAFEYLSATLILLHSVAVGAYVEYLAVMSDHQNTGIYLANLVLGIIFMIEVGLKMGAERWEYFCGKDWVWNIFDCALVALLGAEFVMHAMHIHNLVAMVKIGEMIRTGRMLRILKCLKLSTTFKLIISKIIFSVKSLFWVVLLVFMLLYVVAVCITQGVVDFMHGEQHHSGFDKHHLSAKKSAILEQFGSVEKALYTLFQSITGGQLWGNSADLLREVHPCYCAIFIAFIALTTLCVLNVVTGIFIEATIMSAKHQRDEMTDTERHHNELQAQFLREVFWEIDADGDGVVPLEEFEELMQDDRVRLFLQSMKIGVTDVKRLFKMLDQDNSGEIEIDEFVNGCMHLQGGARNFDVHRLLAGQRRMQRHFDQLACHVSMQGGRSLQRNVSRRKSPTILEEQTMRESTMQSTESPATILEVNSEGGQKFEI